MLIELSVWIFWHMRVQLFKDHVAFLPINPWSTCMLQFRLVFSAELYQEPCDQTLKIQLIHVLAVTLNSQKDDISLYTSMQWHIRNNSPQKEAIQRESFVVERHFHIRKSIKNIEESSTNEQGHRIEIKMTQMKQRKEKQSGNETRLVRGEILHMLITWSAVTKMVPVL